MQGQQFRPAEEADVPQREYGQRVEDDGGGEAGKGHVREASECRGAEEAEDDRPGENVRQSGDGHQDRGRSGDRKLRRDAVERAAVGESPVERGADDLQPGDQQPETDRQDRAQPDDVVAAADQSARQESGDELLWLRIAGEKAAAAKCRLRPLVLGLPGGIRHGQIIPQATRPTPQEPRHLLPGLEITGDPRRGAAALKARIRS